MAEEEKKEAPKPEEKKKKAKKGKKSRTGRKHSKVDMKTYYTVKGSEIERSRKACPRCGPGTFLAIHKGRTTCGKCEYTEFGR